MFNDWYWNWLWIVVQKKWKLEMNWKVFLWWLKHCSIDFRHWIAWSYLTHSHYNYNIIIGTQWSLLLNLDTSFILNACLSIFFSCQNLGKIVLSKVPGINFINLAMLAIEIIMMRIISNRVKLWVSFTSLERWLDWDVDENCILYLIQSLYLVL